MENQTDTEQVDVGSYVAAIYEQQTAMLAELKHANKVNDLLVAQAVQTAKHTRTMAFVAGIFGVLLLLGFLGSFMGLAAR